MEQFAGIILAGVIGVLAAILAMRQWHGASATERIAMIERAVAAAYQMYPSEPGEFRFDWVFDRVVRWLPNDDAEWIEAMIEAAVYRMKERERSESDSEQIRIEW